MTLWQYNACLEGYYDHIVDLRTVAVEQGYYSAYYSNTKRPKPVNTVIENMRKQSKKQSTDKQKAGDPNIEAFQCLDETFKGVINSGR